MAHDADREPSGVLTVPDEAGAVHDGWELMDRFVLRSPGFAFGRLDALRSSAAVDAVERLAMAEARVGALQARFAELLQRLCDREQDAGAARETFRTLYDLGRTVRRAGDVAPSKLAALPTHAELTAFLRAWSEALQIREGAEVAAQDAFAAALTTARGALRGASEDPRFREAVWMSNPHMYETGLRSFDRHWTADRRPSKMRGLERRLYSYLQRLCAKNETISFFGPLNYGDFGPRAGVSYRRSASPIRRRRVFFAYWAAAALAAEIAAEPNVQPHLRPRRAPLRSANGLADARLRDVHARCDARRSVRAIAGDLDRSSGEVLDDVRRLVARKLVRLDLPIAPSLLDPLAHVAAFVDRLPTDCRPRERWAAALTAFEEDCEQFAGADLEQRQHILRRVERRFEELTETASRRAAGQMFRDRGLLYEECLGAIEELRLGPEHRRRVLDAVEPCVALCATVAQLRHDGLEAAACELVSELAPARRTVPLIEFLAAWRRRHPQPPRCERAERLVARLGELVAAASDGSVCRLTKADLRPLCQAPHQHVVCSPDLMLAARGPDALAAGDFTVVLGELHHGAQAAGWMLCFADDGWRAEVERRLPPSNGETPANLLLGRRMKTAPPEFPGPSVGASAVSADGGQLDLSDLSVTILDGQPRLVTPDGERLRLYPPCYEVPDALFAPFASLSYPLVRGVTVVTGAHTPRIEVEGAVYQRERWDVPADAIPRLDAAMSDFERFCAVHDVKRRMGWPERVFVRTPNEPKPVYVDFANCIAVELLCQLANQAEGPMTVSAMLPGPDELWLQGDDGPYCCELRTVMSLGAA